MLRFLLAIYSSMTISPGMQLKIDKINKLIEEGYTLNKKNGFIDFRNSSGKTVNIYGFKPPAGFSWIAFFFPFAVCTQIKEWSYFYITGGIFAIVSIVNVATGFDATNACSIAIGMFYASMFPYLRKIASDSGITENSKLKSIIIGLLLSIVCVIPSLIIEGIFLSS